MIGLNWYLAQNKAVAGYNGSLSLIAAVTRRNIQFPHILDRVDLLLSPSSFLADTIAATGVVSRTRLKVSPHGHDVKTAESGSQKSRSDHIRFGYIGQLLPHKGVHLLIQAFRQTADERHSILEVYGDPGVDAEYSRYLRQLASDSPGVHFRGAFAPDDIGKVLQNIDVVVVPSTWYENAPLTVAEAFAAKTPVIASNQGGLAEVIMHGVNGLLFARNDHNDLAKQMLRFLDEPCLRDRLAAGITPPRSFEDEIHYLHTIYEGVLCSACARGAD